MGDEARTAFISKSAANVPVKRVGKQEDVAEAVLSIVGNSFITDIILPVDGGYLLTGTLAGVENATK